jgi:hypothetical protein
LFFSVSAIVGRVAKKTVNNHHTAVDFDSGFFKAICVVGKYSEENVKRIKIEKKVEKLKLKITQTSN